MDKILEKIRADYLSKINSASTLKELDEVFLSLFGKKGELTLATHKLPNLPKEELVKVGPLLNKIKIELEQAIASARERVREAN